MLPPITNARFVDGLEEFEKIELKLNETLFCFDNFQPCFYMRERDKFGNYSCTRVYFYENFAEKVQRLEKDEFIKKCQKAGLDEFKTECACKFFLENKKPQEVWLWAISEKKKDIEWDSITILKHRLKKKLFPEMVKHKQKVNN